MATGWPMKTTYANGDVYSASDVNDITGTVNLLQTSTLSSAGGKNVIINGGLDIWQRGTSSASSGVYLADRWYQITSGTTTVSRDTDVPSGVPVQYSIKWVTSASSSFGQFYQMIEQANVIPLRGQTLTASFYIKTSGTAYSNSLILRVEYNTTSDIYGGGTWVNLSDNSFTGSSVTSWTRKTNTFTVPSNAVGIRFSLIPDAVQASGVSVFMTGAQVERGSYATTFSRAGGSIQGELAACQRYYEKSILQTSTPGANGNVGEMWFPNGTIANGETWQLVRFAVTKRTSPTVTTYSYSGTSGRAANDSGTNYGADSANVWRNGDSYAVIKNNSGSSMTVTSVRWVYCNWTADAEL